MRKKICYLLAGLLVCQAVTPAYGEEASPPSRIYSEGKMISADEAVKTGLKNSKLLEKVIIESDLRKIVAGNSKESGEKLKNAKQDLSDAENTLSAGTQEIYDSSLKLDAAKAAIDNGIAPADIPVPIPLPSGTVMIIVKRGSEIRGSIISALMAKMIPEETAKAIADAALPNIISAAKSQLSQSGAELDKARQKVENGIIQYNSGKSELESSASLAIASIASKLGTSTINSLEKEALGDLIGDLALIQEKTTAYSVNIYKNQIALLIRNCYSNALKEKKLLELAEISLKRGETQYEYAQYAYEIGAKSKDDMILAKSYYEGTKSAYDIQLKNYKNAMLELKKNMGTPFSEKIMLDDNMIIPENEQFDIEKGVSSGLKNRLEIKVAEAKLESLEKLMKAVKDSGYKSDDPQYKEVELLIKQSTIDLENTKLSVETEIRQTYESLYTAQKLVKSMEELKSDSEETLEIAKLKYEVGFGMDNALLSKMNLKDVSGTMVEVISAEENEATIEQKYIEARSGYILAKQKYLNDIGVLPYE